jgi:hypothetical protein
MIRRLLLATCIVAVTTPAITQPEPAFRCGTSQIAFDLQNYHYFDMTNPKHWRLLPNRLFTGHGNLFYKGQECTSLLTPPSAAATAGTNP